MRRLCAILLLLLAVVAVYWQVGNHSFVNWDDNLYVYENPQVQRGLTLEGTAWAFTTSFAALRQPLTWLSHMAAVSLFGQDPGWHHRVNVLFHMVNAVLLFLVLHSMTGSRSSSWTIGRSGASRRQEEPVHPRERSPARGRTDEAIAHYRAAIRIWPGYAVAHNNLGVALAAAGDLDGAIAHYDDAIVHFRTAVRIDPSFPDAAQNLQDALAGGSNRDSRRQAD